MRAAEVLRTVSGVDEVVRVPARWLPPPRLSGRSCVYCLQLRGERAPAALYVGESDSIEKRLVRHRRAHAGARVECVLVEVESKSAALELEALAIRRLKQIPGVGCVRNVVERSV